MKPKAHIDYCMHTSCIWLLQKTTGSCETAADVEASLHEERSRTRKADSASSLRSIVRASTKIISGQGYREVIQSLARPASCLKAYARVCWTCCLPVVALRALANTIDSRYWVQGPSRYCIAELYRQSIASVRPRDLKQSPATTATVRSELVLSTSVVVQPWVARRGHRNVCV